jgi:hypothetical protein
MAVFTLHIAVMSKGIATIFARKKTSLEGVHRMENKS